jgi:hypothetical protein
MVQGGEVERFQDEEMFENRMRNVREEKFFALSPSDSIFLDSFLHIIETASSPEQQVILCDGPPTASHDMPQSMPRQPVCSLPLPPLVFQRAGY